MTITGSDGDSQGSAMNKCERTKCDEHECDLCANIEEACSDEPCDRCSIIGNGTTCQYETEIFKSGSGTCHSIDFCGYRVWPGYTKPRRRTIKAARKRFKKLSVLYGKGLISISRMNASVASFTGYMKHCNGSETAKSVLGNIVLTNHSISSN